MREWVLLLASLAAMSAVSRGAWSAEIVCPANSSANVQLAAKEVRRGLHTYPFHNKDLGPEPTVWVGLPDDVNADGTVKVSDRASWYTTAKFQPYGCYSPDKTGNYSFGGAEVFPSDNYGPEVNGGDDFPLPKTPEASVAMMNRTGTMLKTVLAEAHRLGMKTCVGTESPLDVPDTAKARLKAMGMNLDDPGTLQKLYAGMFTRIQRTYPIDYYWLWGHEGDIDVKRFVANVQAAHAALKETKAPFALGVCGWGWTANHFPELDKALPKDVFFSAISMATGHAPLSPNFGRLENRQKWAIPWFEDDGVLTSLQLRAGRMRRDAADAHRYGCDGLMGLHWRTRIIGPNIAALAQAGWEQGAWRQPGTALDKERDLPVADFYADWATAQFGREAGLAAAAIFTEADGHFPTPSAWTRGPGAIAINHQPWAKIASQYAFVDAFSALRPHVQGTGNLERFDWWLNTFRVTKFMGQFGCARGELDAVIKRIEKEKNPQSKRRLAREQALPIRLRMVDLLGDLYDALLATLSNATELGTICNIEQQSMLRLKLLSGQDAKLAQLLGEPLPTAAQPWKEYRGAARLVVMTARTAAAKGESLTLKIVALDKQPVKAVAIHVRPLGKGDWQTMPTAHVARAVYEAKLPAAEEDFEYYVTAGDKLVWPATAPQLNQTVVVAK